MIRTALSVLTRAQASRAIALILLVFVVGATWSVTTPMGAGPDEPNHMATAYAVAHGEVGRTRVMVPEYIAALSSERSSCFAFKPDQPADCQGELAQSSELTQVDTQFGTYFPLYFWVVGAPSLFLSGTSALAAMRLVSIALFAIIIGISAFLATQYEPKARAAVGVFCSLTPTALFLGGVVNSSSFEIATAILTWTSALIAFRADVGALRPRFVAIFVVGASLLLSSRLLAPLWIAIILASVLTFNGTWKTFFRFLTTRAGVACTGALTLILSVTGGWSLTHPNHYLGVGGPPTSTREALAIFVTSLVRQSPDLLQSAAGTLGWLETVLAWAPLLVYPTWALLVGASMNAASRTRERAVMVVLCGLGVLLPAALETAMWSGQGWQGRYTLPLLVGIPLVAAFANNRRDTQDQARLGAPWTMYSAVTLIFIAGVYSVVMNAHRYSVGLSASLLGSTNVWEGPLGFWLPLAANTLALSAFAGMTLRRVDHRQESA